MLIYFLALILPDPSTLGVADYHDREAAHHRCNNALTALALPARHDCPEIDRRVKEIRTTQLRWGCPYYCERRYRSDNWQRWAAEYLAAGRSLLAYDYETFEFFFANGKRSDYLFSVLPVQPGGNHSFINPQLHETDYPRWCEYIGYHYSRAPMPRAK